MQRYRLKYIVLIICYYKTVISIVISSFNFKKFKNEYYLHKIYHYRSDI